MLLSELRKLVRDTGSSEMKSTFRPLQQECFSSVAQMYRILSLGTNESHSPVTRVVQRVGDVRSPNLKRLAWMRRNEKSAPAPTPVLQSRRYVPKLVRRERHRPEVSILSEADREIQNIDAPYKSRRTAGIPRLRKHARDRIYSPAAESHHSTMTAKMIHQFRRAVVDGDVSEAFQAKAAEQKSPRLSRRDSVRDGSVIESQLSVATGVQGSLVSQASGMVDTDGSRASQNDASTSRGSSMKSTFASSFRTSMQSSFWNSTFQATNASTLQTVTTKSSLSSVLGTGTGFTPDPSDRYRPPQSFDM